MLWKSKLNIAVPLAFGLTLVASQFVAAQDRAAFNDRAAQARQTIGLIASSSASNAEQARSAPRIVNGQFVDNARDQGAWEFAASLQHPLANGHFCGGVLVAPTLDTGVTGTGAQKFVKVWKRGEDEIQMILTAAHCITDKNGKLFDSAFFDDMTVLSGMTNIADVKVRQTVNKVVKHPDYNPDTNAHDIAVILLDPPAAGIPDGATPRSIALPSILDMPAYSTTTAGHTVLGWGRTQAGALSQVLQSVLVPFSDQSDCQTQYAALGNSVHTSSFCAGFSSGGFDSCQGDSGGPLVYRPTISDSSSILGAPILTGLVSWGRGCGFPGFAGVYADILQHKAWIEAVVIRNDGHF